MERDVLSETTWVWNDAWTGGFTNWSPGEPNGKGRTAADLDIESRFTVLRVLEEKQKSQTEEGFVCLCN